MRRKDVTPARLEPHVTSGSSGAEAEEADLGDLDRGLLGRQLRDPHEVVAVALARGIELDAGARLGLVDRSELLEPVELPRRRAVRRGVDRALPVARRRD